MSGIMDPVLDTLARKTATMVREQPGDYYEDGLLYCGKCYTAKQVRVFVNGKTREPYCLCKCAAESRDRERLEASRAEREQNIVELRKRCFTRLYGGEGRFRETNNILVGYTFSADDGEDQQTGKIARSYAENFDKMRQDGKGLLFYGGVGGGKTFFAACIANALIDRGIPCYFTSVSEIAGRMLNRFGNWEEIDKLNAFPLVILDDLGAERNTEYMTETVLSIIDARTRSGLPLIVTSNFTGEELQGAADISTKRIFSRLYEICIPVNVSHSDRRRKKLRDDFCLYRTLLGMENA